MDKKQLDEIVRLHDLWLRGKHGGVRANLVRANLAGANLAGANLARANLAGANLARAKLAGANLVRAKLAGANLAGANLVRADLSGANLAGANLAGATLTRGLVWFDAGTRLSDPYRFTVLMCVWDCVPRIYAGCREGFTPDQYRQHAAYRYPNTPKSRQTLAIIDRIEAIAQEQILLWKGK